jgi:peptide deformylase
MKLPLLYYGNPLLRKKGARIAEINGEIRQIVDDMMETMHGSDGIGLAAPQVGHSLSLFIAMRMKEDEQGEWQEGPLQVFINPVIVSYSQEVTTYNEGCLSLPKLYCDVTRPRTVTMTATDLEGKEFTEEFCDFQAHIVLHENDHVNGVLFIDRLDSKSRKALEPELRAIKKKYCK